MEKLKNEITSIICLLFVALVRPLQAAQGNSIGKMLHEAEQGSQPEKPEKIEQAFRNSGKKIKKNDDIMGKVLHEAKQRSQPEKPRKIEQAFGNSGKKLKKNDDDI